MGRCCEGGCARRLSGGSGLVCIYRRELWFGSERFAARLVGEGVLGNCCDRMDAVVMVGLKKCRRGGSGARGPCTHVAGYGGAFRSCKVWRLKFRLQVCLKSDRNQE